MVVREGFAAALIPGNAHLHRLALAHLLAVFGFGLASFCLSSALFGFYGLPVSVVISGKYSQASRVELCNVLDMGEQV